jgi:undecaprenyl phosphate-alpha-L-ara4FN deformylase
MRAVRDAGFEVGLHTFDHVRWQDYVAQESAAWTRVEFERGCKPSNAFSERRPQSHAAAGWQINAHALELEQDYGLQYASDTRGGPAFFPRLADGPSPVRSCPPRCPPSTNCWA